MSGDVIDFGAVRATRLGRPHEIDPARLPKLMVGDRVYLLDECDGQGRLVSGSVLSTGRFLVAARGVRRWCARRQLAGPAL